MPIAYKSSQAWLHRFAILTAIFTFALLFIGGLVTSHQAGLSVPDWPTSYGWSMFTFPMKDWTGNIFYEHTHRLFASAVGFLIMLQAFFWQERTTHGFTLRSIWIWPVAVILYFVFGGGFLGGGISVLFLSTLAIVQTVRAFRNAKSPLPLRLSWLALSFVTVQGFLGGLTVILYLPPAVSSAHAGLGQATFCLTLAIAMVTNKRWDDRIIKRTEKSKFGLRTLSLVTVIVIFIQLLLGAVMRHTSSGLAIPTWPLAPSGGVIPDFTSFGIAINFAHRTWALVVTLMMFITARSIFRWFPREKSLIIPMTLGMFLLGLQIMLGAITIWTKKAVTPTTLHVSGGAAILGTMVYIMIKCRHLLAPKADHPSYKTDLSHVSENKLPSLVTE